MAKKTSKLTSLQVKKISAYGFYSDGNGLYLQVSKSGSKSWVFRYEANGKGRKQGLGSATDLTLSEARVAASESRKLRLNGKDPIDEKKKISAVAHMKAVRAITFKACATSYIDSHKASWTNSKHIDQWTNTLTTYAYPVIGHLPAQDVDVSLVMKILEPIWVTKTETATRVRQRIENILDWAKVRDYRSGENPARWRGHLNMLLPNPAKLQKVKHFNAMPFIETPAYFTELREKNTVSAMALSFLILTATRSNETRSATWDEVDLDNAVWTIPENRMKAKIEHTVSLSPECLEILVEAKAHKINNFIFPSENRKTGISSAALQQLLRSTQTKATMHGFRSSFRDWCAEMTDYDSRVAEFSLAHQLKDTTEAAYLRSRMVEKRRKLMNEWSSYCKENKKIATVTPIAKRA